MTDIAVNESDPRTCAYCRHSVSRQAMHEAVNRLFCENRKSPRYADMVRDSGTCERWDPEEYSD